MHIMSVDVVFECRSRGIFCIFVTPGSDIYFQTSFFRIRIVLKFTLNQIIVFFIRLNLGVRRLSFNCCTFTFFLTNYNRYVTAITQEKKNPYFKNEKSIEMIELFFHRFFKDNIHHPFMFVSPFWLDQNNLLIIYCTCKNVSLHN